MTPTVSVPAAERQAFGVMFNHSSNDKRIVQELLDGRLELRPHPAWKLPTQIHWRSNPFNDLNWQSQLHMLRWMDPLRRRAEKGDSAAADAWLNYAGDWVAQNPSSNPMWAAAWRDMVDGIRALELCAAVPFVSRYAPEALDWLVPSIQEHGEWLSDEKNLGHSNHALHQHQGLFICGAVLENEDMMRMAEGRLADLFRSSYDDEGINTEGAIAYHFANYNWWNVARKRLAAEGRKPFKEFDLLDNVPEELAHATKPNGEFVGIGDTDGGSPRYIKHPAIKWVTTAGADGEPPEDLVKFYEAGYLFARSGWGEQERDFKEETFWSASFGSAARIHGHPDGGSLTFSSMGHEWITDPGKFQYGKSPMRDYCTSRRSHSLPFLLTRKYDPASFVTCTARRTSGSTYDFTFVDDGYEGARITRRIIYSISGEYLVVIDNIDSDTEVTAVQNWQCGIGTNVERAANGFTLDSGDKKAAIFYTGTAPKMATAVAKDEPVLGWVATGWKKREPAPTVRFVKTGTNFRFVTVIAAGFRGVTPSFETVRSAKAGEVRLRVDTGRVAEQIIVSANGAEVVSYSTDASSTPPVPVQKNAMLLDPMDPAARHRILTDTRRARRAAWDAESSEERQEIAKRVQKLQSQFRSNDGTDLGMQSTLHDIRATTLPKTTTREIQRVRPGLINWNQRSDFRPTYTNAPMRSLYGAAQEVPSISQDTIFTYTLGSLVLPALLAPSAGDTLTVLFQTAIDRARTQLPFFQRFRFQKELRAGPTMAVADPTLDMSRELRLGWYLGNEAIDLPRSIAIAVRKVAEMMGTTKIVLQGGSGGGFAALQVGAHIPGSHVIAFNPQSDLRKYSVKAYRAASIAAFGLRDASENTDFIKRVSVMERMAALNSDIDITLVMNSGDAYHERNHAAPLRDFVENSARSDISNYSFDLGPGHRGFGNDQYATLMNDLYKRIDSSRPTGEQ